MGRHASAVIGLLQCHVCKGYVALGTCVCANKKEKGYEKITSVVPVPRRGLAPKQSLIGAL